MKLIFKNKYQTFLTILFLFLISCSDQVENNLTANEIITNSSSRVSEWNSFRFSLEHEEYELQRLDSEVKQAKKKENFN